MKNRTHSLKPRLEGLEDRQLLTIGLDAAGLLSVAGTNSADTINVENARIILYFTGASSSNPMGGGNNLGTPVYGAAIKAAHADMNGNVLETQTFRASVSSRYHDGPFFVGPKNHCSERGNPAQSVLQLGLFDADSRMRRALIIIRSLAEMNRQIVSTVTPPV